MGVVVPLKSTPMTNVTQILKAIGQGDPSAAGQLLPLVLDELRQLSHLARDHLRLVGPHVSRQSFPLCIGVGSCTPRFSGEFQRIRVLHLNLTRFASD